MAGTPRYSTERVIAAIQDSGGIKADIAKRLGCTRDVFNGYLKRNPAVKAAYEMECASAGDMAESKLLGLIKKENIVAIIFYLKTKHKARGYVERYQGEMVDPQEVGEAIKNVIKSIDDSVPVKPKRGLDLDGAKGKGK